MIELFIIFSVFLCFLASKTKYSKLAIWLLVDFVAIYLFDHIWRASDIPGGVWMLPVKGITLYMLFYYVYLQLKGVSIVLAAMAGVIGIIHIMNPLLGWFTEGNYSEIMIVYCIMQLLAVFSGVSYELVYRHIASSDSGGLDNYGDKGA